MNIEQRRCFFPPRSMIFQASPRGNQVLEELNRFYAQDNSTRAMFRETENPSEWLPLTRVHFPKPQEISLGDGFMWNWKSTRTSSSVGFIVFPFGFTKNGFGPPANFFLPGSPAWEQTKAFKKSKFRVNIWRCPCQNPSISSLLLKNMLHCCLLWFSGKSHLVAKFELLLPFQRQPRFRGIRAFVSNQLTHFWRNAPTGDSGRPTSVLKVDPPFRTPISETFHFRWGFGLNRKILALSFE